MKWTATLVQEELPPVPVRFADGTEQDAALSGRRSQFPTVNVKVHGSWLRVQATWESIANVLNEHQALRI